MRSARAGARSRTSAGRRHACRHFLLVAYAVVVILLATYPSNALLLALLFGHPRDPGQSRRAGRQGGSPSGRRELKATTVVGIQRTRDPVEKARP
jgi:hypothetical protein